MPNRPSVWAFQTSQQGSMESPPVADAGVIAAVVARHTTDAPFDNTVDRPAPERSTVAPGRSLRERLRRPLMLAFPIMLAVVGAGVYLAEEPYVSTDDAFVRAAKESVNARVAGQVVEIAVKDNQRVLRGQLLFQVDPEPYRIAVDQAEARLEQRTSPDQRAQGDLSPGAGRAAIGERHRGLRRARVWSTESAGH